MRWNISGRRAFAKTVGVVGTGHIGGRVIELLSGFTAACSVIRPITIPGCADRRIYRSGYLISNSDILTFHVPIAINQTHGKRGGLKENEEGVVLINTARGELLKRKP
ncbi:MAG: NAD(P)-dependent oxidoreductase [Christensenellaceae bacterium]